MTSQVLQYKLCIPETKKWKKKINEGLQKQKYNFLKALLIEKFFLKASHQMVNHNPVLFQAISVSLGH